MKYIRTKIAILLMIFCSISCLAESQNVANPTSLTKLYFGFDVGYGAFKNSSSLSIINKEASDTDLTVKTINVAAGIHFGYNFNQYIAAQIEYLLLPPIVFSDDYTSGSVVSSLTALDIKAQYPLFKNKLFPFVTAGYGGIIILSNNGDSNYVNSETTWAPTFGAGLEYRISHHFGISGQYKVIISTSNKFNTVTMGLAGFIIHFG